MQWVEALIAQVEHVRLPSVSHPDGELVLSAGDLSYAGDDTSRASTPPLHHCPSPRVRTNFRSPTRRHIPAGG
eukprot:10506313-Prorocentrum_lima.AAC.1